jgi:hypothetical protein
MSLINWSIILFDVTDIFNILNGKRFDPSELGITVIIEFNNNSIPRVDTNQEMFNKDKIRVNDKFVNNVSATLNVMAHIDNYLNELYSAG